MQKIEDDDIDSEQSQDLKEDQLLAMNKHFKNRRSTRNYKMTPEMEALYKQALMDTFFGRFQQASKKLKTYILLYPDNSDAYHLLGTMYEQLGQQKNAVEYFFMSAYLSSPNFQKWKKIGQMSFNLQMYNQSAYCFGRALKIQNYNIELMTKRAQAFEHSYQSKKAISTYKKILSTTFSVAILKQYAKLRFKRGQYKTARDILMQYSDHRKDPHIAYMICQTYLKEDSFYNLLQYLTGFLQNEKEKQHNFNLQALNLQFTIILFICLLVLKRNSYQPLNTTFDQVKECLINGYEQSYHKQYQCLVGYVKSEHKLCEQILGFLIGFDSHKTVQNYLIYTQNLKKSQKFKEAVRILKQALNIHNNSVELTSQLNHIQVISGNWKQIKRGQVLDFKKNRVKNPIGDNEDIFYSDQESEDILGSSIIREKTQKANKQRQEEHKQSKHDYSTRMTQKKSIQTEDPQIIRRLLLNCKQTLESIVSYNSEERTNLISCFKQVQDCIAFIINLTSAAKVQEEQQNQGLFNRTYRRRRYFTSKQYSRQNVINSNLTLILEILGSIVKFTKNLLENQHFNKVKSLAQMLSKAYFFRWQNKSPDLKKIKKSLYEIGLLACLSLEKYQTAVFFVKYLAHRQPDNSFYLLIINYLIHNSNSKICMNSLLGKYVNRGNVSNGTKTISNNDSFFIQEQSLNLLEDEQIYDGLSCPRKMSNFSNFSDCFRGNVKLNYLFGIQYMETGCFDLAIASFLKIINQCQGQIKKTIWLGLSACFLQISSSRTCHSKLPVTNGSTYCFWQYMNSCDDQIQKLFNKARFLSQLRFNLKAIKQYNEILLIQCKSQQQSQIQLKSAHCLICIYKEIQDWDMVNRITQRFFNVEIQHQS